MRAQVVSFHCTIKNRLGQILSSSFNQDVINQQGNGTDRLQDLVDGLQSVKAGEKRSIAVPASRAFGAYDPRLTIELKRSELAHGDKLKEGGQVIGRLGDTGEPRTFRIIRLRDSSVILDGNHPFAGHDLIFEVEIVSAREAQESDFLEDGLSRQGQNFH